jgi:hypothetical protein
MNRIAVRLAHWFSQDFSLLHPCLQSHIACGPCITSFGYFSTLARHTCVVMLTVNTKLNRLAKNQRSNLEVAVKMTISPPSPVSSHGVGNFHPSLCNKRLHTPRVHSSSQTIACSRSNSGSSKEEVSKAFTSFPSVVTWYTNTRCCLPPGVTF